MLPPIRCSSVSCLTGHVSSPKYYSIYENIRSEVNKVVTLRTVTDVHIRPKLHSSSLETMGYDTIRLQCYG